MLRHTLLCVGVCVALARPAAADREDVTTAMKQRVATVNKTEALLLDKLNKRTAEVRRRVRSLYKLMRSGPAPLWVEPAERSKTVRRRAAAGRILRRDFRELALLRAELDAVQTARERLEKDQQLLATLTWPSRRSLVSPIAGRIRIAGKFGDYTRKKPYRVNLSRRGLALRVKDGRKVTAMAGGRVRYVGKIRNLGNAVIIEHNNVLTVLGPLTKTSVTKLQHISQGSHLGMTVGNRLYLEVRLPIGAGGFPIDPAPFLNSTR